jgi:hypothetical protein
MSDKETSWRVLEHGPLVELSENCWHTSGALPFGTLRRTMTIAKRADDTLVVHGAIAMHDAEMKAIEKLGDLAFLIIPNGWHRLDAVKYKRRYPQLKVFTPAGAKERVSKIMHVDGVYEDFPNDDAVKLETLPGVGDAEGVMTVHSSDGTTLVLNDVMFNMDTKKDFPGWFFTTLMGSAPGPRISRLIKVWMVKNRADLRGALERLANTPNLQRLVVAHEKLAIGPDAAAALGKAATFL